MSRTADISQPSLRRQYGAPVTRGHHGQIAYRNLFLRRGDGRGHRHASRDGLLPLQLLPGSFRRTDERVRFVETERCEDHEGRGVCQPLREDRDERPAFLQKVRWPCSGHSSCAWSDARLPCQFPYTDIQADSAPELRGNGAADDGRASQVEGFSSRSRRLRRNAAGMRAHFPAALRSAALMRSCQPGPSSWKKSSTSRSMRSDTISFAPGTAGAFGGRSAGLVVAALNAFSAALRRSGGFLAMRIYSKPPAVENFPRVLDFIPR